MAAPEKLRPFRQWQTGAEWPLMDTHPPNPDPQQPGAQPAAQVAAPTAGEQPAFDVQHAIATLDPKVLMEHREQRRQAVAEYDRPEELRLTEEIEVARMDQFRAEQSAATRQSTARNYQREFATAVEAVEARYPELGDDASAFSRILDDKVAAAKARRDAALADPNYIVAFADEVAEMLGQRAAAAPIQRPPARPSRPVGSSLAPGHGGGQRLTREDVNRLVQSAPIADLRAAIFTE